MNRLLVATRSGGKQREISAILAGMPIDVFFPADLGLDHLPEEESIENADAYFGNALNKAVHFARRSGLPTVADDSGIEVDALNGLPGIKSRRYAGASENQSEANNTLMLERLAGVPADQRAARFRCLVVFVESEQAPPRHFEATCEGRILTAPQGRGGFGYDPIFFSTELQAPLGTVSQAEKETISHRGRSFRSFRTWLEQKIEKEGTWLPGPTDFPAP